MSRFECVINNCGKTHSYEYPLSYFLHVRDDHSRTYHENKEYIDAKIKVLKADDGSDVENLEEERETVKAREAEAGGTWAI